MTLGRRWARFNKALGNRVAGPLFGRLPGFGLVVHRGRVSGREYRTPVKVFRHQGAYVVTLPYGSGTDWVKNVRAAGGCELVVRRRRVALVDPVLAADDGSVRIRRSLRLALSVLRVREFLTLSPAPQDPGGPVGDGAGRSRSGDPTGSRR
ncbi:nitroreductase family deazaflavin-dependent oxidoreductase [Actinacidiphila paucisporea]|uniref:nitroreductase family deazaflavin-dependent oxidoreductase n=1 Tax=Actinacidiphila paucisporea TaxID=310782 RepID=UPI0009A0A54A|nr:nitroreductase family deazaflavin-dependent oxidoreductase [Actinacidiphila paucisporea]